YQRNYGKALKYFAQVLDDNSIPRFFLHWHWRIQARLGRAAALLRSGDIPNARHEAVCCIKSAESTADPHLKALAFEINARVAAAAGESGARWQHIQRSLAILDEFEIPVTAWQIHGAAWELCPDHEEAERHRVVARDT